MASDEESCFSEIELLVVDGSFGQTSGRLGDLGQGGGITILDPEYFPLILNTRILSRGNHETDHLSISYHYGYGSGNPRGANARRLRPAAHDGRPAYDEPGHDAQHGHDVQHDGGHAADDGPGPHDP
jgi:hypothetical protein